jgi:hypothetical protein
LSEKQARLGQSYAALRHLLCLDAEKADSHEFIRIIQLPTFGWNLVGICRGFD